MAIKWKLKKYLASHHSIYGLTEFKKLISKKTGVIISLQNLSNLVNHRPKQVRLETMEIICSALKCELNEIIEITPKKYNLKQDKKKLSYKNTPHSKKSINMFPDPKDYL